MSSLILVVISVALTIVSSAQDKRPNIIMIVADDLGWNDVSFHGSDQIVTPNIDSLAYQGVILHNHYSQALCSPSRAALLTARYPIHTGMQTSVILEPEPWGLPLNFSLLPQHLTSLGYVSHAVGKWHLGFYKSKYTPTKRGFASHFGFWNGYQDYYNHTVQGSFVDYEGYDMRFNESVYWEGVGQYSTDLYTQRAVDVISGHNSSQHPLFLYLAYSAPHAANREDPLQAPQHYIDHFQHIQDINRRKYAGMVKKLDEAVGEVVTTLKDNSMLQDSIIVFVSDNGAATTLLHPNHGSNWPLRGEKGTLLEGGVRTVACVWSPLIEKKHRVFTRLFHISDWMPTLYSAVGGNLEDLGQIDGVDQWEALVGREDIAHGRHEILHNIDPRTQSTAIRVGHLKYIKGTVLQGVLDRWTGETETHQLTLPDYIGQVVNCETFTLLAEFSTHLSPIATVTNLRHSIRIKCIYNYNSDKKGNSCDLRKKPCIFNVIKDPCEQNNLYDSLVGTGIITDFENRLVKKNKTSIKPQNKPTDSKANPLLHNNTWVSWLD